MSVAVSTRRLTGVLAAVLAGLALATTALQVLKHVYGHGRLFGLAPILSVNGERNVGTWFSSFLLLLCAVLLATVAANERRQRDRDALHWAFLAAVFVFLSIDETAMIHETVARVVRRSWGGSGLLYSTWIVAWGGFALAVALAYLRFLGRLPRRTAVGFVLAGALYVGAAAGIEAFQGRGLEAARLAHVVGPGELTPTLEILGCVEELLEMLALVLFADTLLRHLSGTVKELRIDVVAGP